MRGRPGRGAGSGPPATSPCWALLRCRYQLHSQEEAKERRHSHTIGGLPESDDQTELPSPPALPMALVGKGPLTSIGQCPPPQPCPACPSPQCFSPLGVPREQSEALLCSSGSYMFLEGLGTRAEGLGLAAGDGVAPGGDGLLHGGTSFASG